MNTINKLTRLFALTALATITFSGAAFADDPNFINYTFVEGGTVYKFKIPKKVSQPDIVYGFQKDLELKLIAPTDIQPIPNSTFNLAGVQTKVNALEKTVLVNNLDANSSPKHQPGAIAINNSNEHTIAANSGFIPMGAARNVDENNQNNDFNVMGAAYKVDDNETDVDFVIAQPILK